MRMKSTNRPEGKGGLIRRGGKESPDAFRTWPICGINPWSRWRGLCRLGGRLIRLSF
ncbi:hypothetical protein EMPG_14608 [Blastomyces silverae]|uniref:Uncharacterized protein n=1 Tax=Blastomyces silverae TaxID=2060906 RepID=A0A0H1BF39_9EURO|nr:hypothetical protein EMPG_14608 [Blastomyces silverae]